MCTNYTESIGHLCFPGICIKSLQKIREDRFSAKYCRHIIKGFVALLVLTAYLHFRNLRMTWRSDHLHSSFLLKADDVD